MQLKYFVIAIITLNFFTSCKKEDLPASTGIQASSQLNVQYGGSPLQNMDVYLPAGRSAATTKVIIMIHGGAWSSGDKADFTAFVDTLKRRQPDYAIFNLNYRLSASGINVFPTQELDTKAAIEFIYNKRAEYLISDKFVLVGASAGAHLALLHAFKYSSPVKIKAVVDFFGPTDLALMYNNYVPILQANLAVVIGATPFSNASLYQQSSPVTFITTTAACPVIIFQGDIDPLVDAPSQSGRLRDKLQIAAVPVQYNLFAGKDHGTNWGSDTYFDAFNKMQSFLVTYNP